MGGSGKTVILATHNLIQARLLAARVFFLKAGRLVQEGSAAEVLGRPLSLDIAEFSAAENIITGTLVQRDGRTVLARHGRMRRHYRLRVGWHHARLLLLLLWMRRHHARLRRMWRHHAVAGRWAALTVHAGHRWLTVRRHHHAVVG